MSNDDRSRLVRGATALASLIQEEEGSIAIIGNSPVLLDEELGAEIDAHSVIIRINDGRTSGYERHVGSRTSIRYVGVPIKTRYLDYFSNYREESALVTRVENRDILLNIGWSGVGVFIEKYGLIVRSSFSRLSNVITLDDLPAGSPRTGIVILSLLTDAMMSGRRISLYGFDIAAREKGAEHFYADGRKMEDARKNWDRFHCPMEYEFSIISRLHDKSMIALR